MGFCSQIQFLLWLHIFLFSITPLDKFCMKWSTGWKMKDFEVVFFLFHVNKD